MPRTLHLTSPLMHGPDVTAFQINLDERGASRGVHVGADGTYGPVSANGFRNVARQLGIDPDDIARGVTPRLQEVFAHPSKRTKAELDRAGRVAKIDAQHAKEVGHGAAAALAWAHKHVGVKEHPPGSNQGDGITGWLHDVGCGPAPWCGAFVHAGADAAGLELTPDVRYVPAIEQHARMGTGGLLRWVPAGHANATNVPQASLVCFNFGTPGLKHVGFLDRWISPGVIATVEGNTRSGDAGSQDNGGMVAARERNLSLVGGFAIPRW